jgi:soluble lytic murein transglycosylase-like protein
MLPTAAMGQEPHSPLEASAHSVEDDFDNLHTTLNSVADDLLAKASDRLEEKRAEERANITALPMNEGAVSFTRKLREGDDKKLRRSLDRVQQLRPVIDSIFRQAGLPSELVAVALVESGGQTTATSPKGARGVWQFMPETARLYGLVVNSARDERLDIAKETQAAARYLRDLHAQFGDWRLALAAYNAGEQAVLAAMVKTHTASYDLLSSSRALPAETRAYVPAVFSAMELFKGGGAISGPAGSLREAEQQVVFAMHAVDVQPVKE